MNRFKVGVCQLQVVDDKKANLSKARRLIGEAARAGSNLVVLPEMFNCPYQSSLFPVYAEPVPGGETISMLAQAAREEQVYLVGGSIPEKGEYGSVFNTCAVISPEGNILACHRKVHLFDVDLEDGLSFKESETLKAGDELTVVPTSLATLGIGICYDIRFPELARLMVLAGAEVIVLPAAFNRFTGPAHWELLLRSRAVDNQVYVIGASPALNPQATYYAWGRSMVVDPWGSILAVAGENETVLYAEIDPARLEQVRRELPLLTHRRSDLYKITAATRSMPRGTTDEH